MYKFTYVATLVTSLALISCGGSSNNGKVVIEANLQTTLNTPTYAADSEELAAFNAINAFRHSMGLGYWNQEARLDTAAHNHMAYSILNDPSFQEDIEVASNAGFTGATPSARAIHTGYFVLVNTTTATNVPFAAVGELHATGPGATVVNSMVNTIYHRSALMAQNTRVMGLARDSGIAVAAPITHWWFSHGRVDNGQSVASNFLANYPMNGQLNVPLSMTPESPSVFSNQANFNFALQTSSPVSVMSAASTDLNVATFTITPSGSDAPLSGTVWTFDNDPNLLSSDFSKAPIVIGEPPSPVPTLSTYEAYWVGHEPFLPNTTYNVSFTGSIYLVEYNQTTDVALNWSFTTGSD